MQHKKLEARLEALAAKKRALDVEAIRLDARLRQQTKKAEDRRKILLGAWLLHAIQNGDPNVETVRRRLGSFLTRPGDRDLFADLLMKSEGESA